MSDTVEKALELFGLTGASYHLVAARENQVFRVDKGGDALRGLEKRGEKAACKKPTASLF